MIDETLSNAPDQFDRPVNMAKQEGCGIRGHRAACKIGDHMAMTNPFKFKGISSTVCPHRCFRIGRLSGCCNCTFADYGRRCTIKGERSGLGRFGKQDFRYIADEDVYICPARNRLTYRFSRDQTGRSIRRYSTNLCGRCSLKVRCTTGNERRIGRWEHEDVLEAVQRHLDETPQAMRQRRKTSGTPSEGLTAPDSQETDQRGRPRQNTTCAKTFRNEQDPEMSLQSHS